MASVVAPIRCVLPCPWMIVTMSSDAEAVGAQEIVHRVAGPVRFQRGDLLPDQAVGIGGAVVAGVFAPGEGDVVAALLDVHDAIVGLGERAVVNPDVGDRARVAEVNEVPIVPVVVALAAFVPFPQLVELQVPDDDVGGALDVESRVADGGAVGGEDRQPVLLLDVNQADAAGQEDRVQERGGVRAEGLAVGLCVRGDFVTAQVEVVHDLDHLDECRSCR